MKVFDVSVDGRFLGRYRVASSQAARDACARDAGYESEADMVSRLEQPSGLVAAEVDPGRVLAWRIVDMADDAYLSGHPEWAEIVSEARDLIEAVEVSR